MNAIMAIVPVLLLFVMGIVARRTGMLSRQGASEMARILMDMVYPALIIFSIVRKCADDLAANWELPLLTMGIGLIGLGLGLAIVRMAGEMPTKTTRAFVFQCMMNNYLFLPLPLVLLFWGGDGVSLLIFASMGYEFVLWTIGVFILAPGTSIRRRLRSSLQPAPLTLLACLAYVALRDWVLPCGPGDLLPAWMTAGRSMFFRTLEIVGQATIPLSCLIAGCRMAELRVSTIVNKHVWLVSGIRLVAVPLLVLAILPHLPVSEIGRGVLTVVGVMPSAIASVVFSERFGGDTDFITGVLLLTHVGALVTVPLFLTAALGGGL